MSKPPWSMNESQLQTAVIGCARWNGWICAHFRGMQDAKGRWRTPVAADGKGFVDLVLASGDRRGVIFAELKSDDHRTRFDVSQVRWIETLRASGARCYVWTPDQWRDGTIERILRDDAAEAGA